jgi:hypothetical protein
MAIYLPILTSFNDKGLKEAQKGFKDLEGAQAKAKYALGKANKFAAVALGGLVAGLGDAVKAAMDDEKAQGLLASQIKKSTDATDAQIKGVEDYITKAGRQKNFTDDVLRPSMSGLVRATEDVEKAQDLMTLAMDIATAKGIPLETVTKSLEKAYGGNMTALAKLSPELRDMIKDGASLDVVMGEMAKTFGGAASDAANTAAGKFAGMKIAISETKESIGASLMPAVEKVLPFLQGMADWAQKNPEYFTIIAIALGAIAASVVAINIAFALNPFALMAIGIGVLITGIVIAYKKFEFFRNVVRIVVNSVASNFEFMANAFITMINLVIKGINLIKPGKDIDSLGKISIGELGGGGAGGGNTGSIRGFESMGNVVNAVADGTNFDTAISAGGGSPSVSKPIELKAPTGSGTNTMAGGLAGITINMQAGLVSTPTQIGQEIIEAIQQAQRRSGTVFAPA